MHVIAQPQVHEASPRKLASQLAGVNEDRIRFGFALDGDAGAIAVVDEPFDSGLFDMVIGRVHVLVASPSEGLSTLLSTAADRARTLGYAQLLRRVPATHLAEIWALERAGFELMDVGLTFGRTVTGLLHAASYPDLVVRQATDADIASIVNTMLEIPWGSRYESDPAYSADQVRELRSRWLWNSHRGRAAIMLVGELDGQTAGYVTCLLDEGTKHGEIELVGTVPAFRGRRVASRILEHALAWYSERAAHITVRTQATNYAAAALYEKAGFTLEHSDFTFRLSITSDALKS
jgi:GNAT superfamily N-acetyltransferase